MTTTRILTLATLALLPASTGVAGYSIIQGASAPTYTDHAITFDEPGTPTGLVPADTWASEGLFIESGTGQGAVDDHDAVVGGWGLGDGQSFYGSFGIFMTLDHDTNAMSLQAWDSSGPPTPFGGGMGVFLFNDGVEVASSFVTPAWGGLGDTWFDIQASGGDVFDEVRLVGFGFPADTYMDNLSWQTVPSPAACALFGLAGAVARRRRRG